MVAYPNLIYGERITGISSEKNDCQGYPLTDKEKGGGGDRCACIRCSGSAFRGAV